MRVRTRQLIHLLLAAVMACVATYADAGTIEVANQSNCIGDIKKSPDGTQVAISGKVLYYSLGSMSYLEEPDRSAGIRCDGPYLGDYVGSVVDISGRLRTTDGGERYIEISLAWAQGAKHIVAVGASNKSVKMAMMEGLRVTVWGAVKSIIDENTLVISDGSDTEGLTIRTQDQDPPPVPFIAFQSRFGSVGTAGSSTSVGQVIAVTGAAGYEGARLIRAQQIDLLYSPEPPATSFVLTGAVQDDDTKVNIVGAIITVGTYQTTTNVSGQFRLEMPSRPLVETYAIDGRTAGPSPEGYYDFWARANGTIQNAKTITLPVLPAAGGDLGTIYLKNAENPPPLPP